MCLKLASKKLVAETDLLVYKCIDYDKDTDTYCTPFQYLPIVFKDGVTVIEGGNMALTIEKVKNAATNKYVDGINYGVHAYTTKKEAVDTASLFPASGTEVYYAIIPKDCPYYIGLNFDIVTTKLIVFRTKRNFDKYAKGKEIKEI